MSMQMQLMAKTSPEYSFIPVQAGQLQRMQSGANEPDKDCPKCHKRLLNLQRSSTNLTRPSSVPPVVHGVLNSPGQPLDIGTRAFIEPRFGHDFSKVRVHTDEMAAESADAVNALAYTVGHDIVFGAGQYAPGTATGRMLLAHELTHVVQQNSSMANSMQSFAVSEPSDTEEQEANRIAQSVFEGNIPTIKHKSFNRLVQRLGANPGCTVAQGDTLHQAIYNARGWLNKAIPALETTPLSTRALDSLRRNFGPTYGVAANATLIHDRLVAARSAIGTIPFTCASAPADATCAAGHCGWAIPGSRAATICSNVTLTAGTRWQFQAGCVLHETFHATFAGMTAAHDSYSGWHGFSGSSAGYPGTGLDPLLNADSYTTLVIDLS
jgi:hypothetical protein